MAYILTEEVSSGGGSANTDLIADDFDSNLAYSIGDTVIYEDELYKFTSAHAAGDPWDIAEVTNTTVTKLIKNVVLPINPASQPVEEGSIWLTVPTA